MLKCLLSASNASLSPFPSYLCPQNLIEFENICATPNFVDELINTHASSEEIQEIVAPILKNFFSEVHYNRLNQVCEFIDYHNKLKYECFPKITPLQALASFTPNMETFMKTTKGGSCYEFIQYLTEKLPSFLHCNLIPGSAPIWSPQYCHKLSHIAAVITYNNPKNLEDTGFILLDPSFELNQPITIPLHGVSKPIISLGGYILVFSHEKDTILGKIITPNQNNEVQEELWVTYFLKKITNFVDVAIKPLIACTRNLSLITYGDCFKNISDLRVRLDKEIITWGVGLKEKPPIPFDKFLSKNARVDSSFSNNPFLDINRVNNCIEKIILNKELVDNLHSEYIAFLKESARSKEFLMNK